MLGPCSSTFGLQFSGLAGLKADFLVMLVPLLLGDLDRLTTRFPCVVREDLLPVGFCEVWNELAKLPNWTPVPLSRLPDEKPAELSRLTLVPLSRFGLVALSLLCGRPVPLSRLTDFVGDFSLLTGSGNSRLGLLIGDVVVEGC